MWNENSNLRITNHRRQRGIWLCRQEEHHLRHGLSTTVRQPCQASPVISYGVAVEAHHCIYSVLLLHAFTCKLLSQINPNLKWSHIKILNCKLFTFSTVILTNILFYLHFTTTIIILKYLTHQLLFTTNNYS